MSTKFRKCRRGLVAALDQAADEVPCGSLSSPNSVSFQNLVKYHRMMTHVYWTTGQRDQITCVLGRKTFCAAHVQYCEICMGSSVSDVTKDMQTLEDLVSKLEFENELNRVFSRYLQSKNPESSLHQREGANSGMEEESTGRWVHDSNEEYSFLLDMILEIERDSDFTADCDVSSLELDLQLSPV